MASASSRYTFGLGLGLEPLHIPYLHTLGRGRAHEQLEGNPQATPPRPARYLRCAGLPLRGGWPGGRIHTPSPASLAERLSRHSLGVNQGWRRYDEAPARALVRPTRVLRVVGTVKNPAGLTGSGSGQTTLTYAPGGTAPSLVLDYGQDLGGRATFRVAHTSGTTIQTTYSETLRNLGNDGAASVGAFSSGNAQRSDTFTLTRPGPVMAKLIQGGERYELVTLTTPGSVTLSGAGIYFTPLRETPSTMPGHFLSSDRLLNRVWYAGAYTLNLNQMTPGTVVQSGAVNRLHLILDGAKRDRAVWSGDHVISDLTDYYVSDPVYARDSNALFLEHPASSAGEAAPATGVMSQPGPLPGACTPNPNVEHNGCVTWSATYSMLVMTALYHYYLYTGDLAFVRQHWPAVVRQMAWDAQQVGSDGLFAVSSSDDADWNVENVSGQLTYVNAVYVEALRSAAGLSRALGHTAQARTQLRAAATVARAVNRHLWDSSTGVYDASTSQRGSVVQDANVTAILAGIPSRARARRIIRVLERRLSSRFGPRDVSSPAPSGYTQDISPYMGSFNVLADFASGEESAALALIRREWGYMINHDPGGTDWERIQLNGIPKGGPLADSSAHAWSTGPTPALSEYVLGVAPAKAGFSQWVAAPEPGQLSWAQGTVPTPHGPIGVRWQRRRRSSFVLTIQVPRRTSATVEIPLLGARRTIARDGRVVRPNVVRGGYAIFRHVSGIHTWAWAAGR